MLGSKGAETNQFLDFSLFGTSALIAVAKNILCFVAEVQELTAVLGVLRFPEETWAGAVSSEVQPMSEGVG